MLRLVRVELTGFKSFAQTEVVDLERPVTAIVGPNGSGKSNILDAILFTFGEQSPVRLRTSKMDSLIFGGAGDMKRLNFTGVKLTFSPAFQESLQFRDRPEVPGISVGGNGSNPSNGKPHIEGEVSLERRLYRDGVSEYYLGGEQARLRDVDEFFGMMGLGRGSTLDITQGEVEKKILANPQEMRQWLVSACGIGLLIDKKRRTEDKLSETRNNLERVLDLVSSTRRRVETLAKEREDAIEYARLEGELKALRREALRRDLAECHHQIAQHYETIKEIRAKLEELNKVAETAEAHEVKLAAEFDEARSAVEHLLENLADAQRLHDEAETRIGALEVELKMLGDREAGLSARNEEAERQLESAKSQIARLEKDIKEQSSSLKTLEKSFDKAKLTLEAAEKNSSEARAEMSRRTEEKLDSERLLLDIENRLGMAKAAIERVDMTAARLEREARRDEAALGEIQTKIAELDSQRKLELERVRTADSDAAKAVENLEERKSKLSKAVLDRDEVRDTLAAVDARIKSLRMLEEEAEGFSPGKKALLTDAKLKEKLRGATDLWAGIEYPPEFSGAVYLVLSQFEDAVEVGDISAGVRALSEFHAGGIGKARLIQESRDAEVPQKPDWWPKGSVRFFELLKGGNGRLGRMYAEIGEVAVCGSIDEAEKMIKNNPKLSWAVVRDGAVMIGRGQAVGGAPSAGSRVLSRRSQIDELAREANRLNVEWAAAESGVKSATESVEAAQSQVESRVEQKSKHLKELAVIDERISSLRGREEELALSLSAVRLELENTETERLELGNLISSRELEVSEARTAHSNAEAANEKAVGEYESAEAALKWARDKLAFEGEELRVARLSLSHLETQLSDAGERAAEAGRQLKTIDAEMKATNKRRAEVVKSLETEASNRSPAEEALGKLRSGLESAKRAAEDAKNRLEEAKGRVRDKSGNAERLERDLSKFEVARGRLLYRYYDLWVNWRSADTERKRLPDKASEDSPISAETASLFAEAVLLFNAWAESQGIHVALEGGEADDEGIEPTGEDRAAASYSQLEAMNAELRSLTEPAGESKSAGAQTADGCDATDDGFEQLELAEAPENVISKWEQGALPNPPSPPLAIDSLEKMGRTRLREKVAEAESAVRELGEVNLKAPAQWEEESSRLRFFLLQHSDMQNALQQLTELLAKLDRDTLKRYTSRTGRIAERFSEYFNFLFGGGAVAIKFTEPDDVLASGVEVMVTLPGERTQPLRSLSGGERSLVFLALFLAAHSIGESGFCIMDEADAALDDSNILRLGKLVNAIAAHTQFILVTHNKRTMELADGLIGVVGRPKGVSRVIPVDLAGAAKYAEAGVAGA